MMTKAITIVFSETCESSTSFSNVYFSAKGANANDLNAFADWNPVSVASGVQIVAPCCLQTDDKEHEILDDYEDDLEEPRYFEDGTPFSEYSAH